MNIKRLFAIGFIFLIACGGWFILGGNVALRSNEYTNRLLGKVRNLCGEELAQTAPNFTARTIEEKKSMFSSKTIVSPEEQITPTANLIDLDLDLEYRRKGLVWFPVYNCKFDASYTLKNAGNKLQKVKAHFNFPSSTATYDNFTVELNGQPVPCDINTSSGVDIHFSIPPNEKAVYRVYYKSRGIYRWTYFPQTGGAGKIHDLTMKVRTDFRAIDFPEDSLSPHEKQVSANGCQLLWKADNLITSRPVAIVMPEKLNPGPLVSKVTFFAPVCLLFFFIVMMSITVIAKINIHPMHYLFISAGFFAFNLLFAYLVDVINVHLAFIISTVVTLILVNSYLRTALGAKYPWKWGAAAQFCYLILFSYSFFFKGLTGLTVTIGSIITLAVLMYLTVRIDWTEIFKSNRQRKREKSNYYSEEKSINA